MKDRLRVLFLSSWPIGAHGQGAISFIYEQIDILSHEVDAAYAQHRFESVPSWLRRKGRKGNTEPILDLWPKRVQAFTVFTPRVSTRLTGRSVLEDVARSGEAVATQVMKVFGKPDLVHAHVVLPAGLLGGRIASSLGVPLLLQEHSGPFEMHLDSQEKRAFVTEVFSRAWRICAVGDELARRMSSAGASPDKVTSLPNLVSTDCFVTQPQKVPEKPLRLVSVGSLTEIKRFDRLIHAVNTIRGSDRKVHLSIVGDGPLRQPLHELADALELTDSITFRGHLSRGDTASAVADAHIYVCSSDHETFGLAPAEALSVGRPVVTTPCGGPPEFVGASEGIVIPSADPLALADGILSVAGRLREYDPDQLHASIDARFGPDAFRRRVLAVYDRASILSDAQ